MTNSTCLCIRVLCARMRDCHTHQLKPSTIPAQPTPFYVTRLTTNAYPPVRSRQSPAVTAAPGGLTSRQTDKRSWRRLLISLGSGVGTGVGGEVGGVGGNVCRRRPSVPPVWPHPHPIAWCQGNANSGLQGDLPRLQFEAQPLVHSSQRHLSLLRAEELWRSRRRA